MLNWMNNQVTDFDKAALKRASQIVGDDDATQEAIVELMIIGDDVSPCDGRLVTRARWRKIDDQRRNRRRLNNERIAFRQQSPSTDFNPQWQAMQHETVLAVRSSIKNLPARYRAILQFELDGKPTDEIARQLGLSPRSVRRLRRQAYDRLRRQLISVI